MGGWRQKLFRLALGMGLLVVAACAVRAIRWGRPVPQDYRPAGVNRWAGAAGQLIEARDIDNDGVWERFHFGDSFFSRPSSKTAGSRRPVVCLDGVPYSLLRGLWDQGHFREFFPPAQLISTFPSETEVALTSALHAPPAPGYENRHFDWKQQRVAGGIALTLAQSAPYLQKLDYDEPGIFKGLQYVLPTKSYRADLGRLRKRFLASRAPLFIAHISSTDGLCHIYRPEQLRPLLLEFADLLRDLYLAEGGRLRMLVFSDHGNNLTPSRPVSFAGPLKRAGFRLSDALEQPRDLVLPQFGLVSFAAVYCRPEIVGELAGVLAGVQGVELVAYRQAPVRSPKSEVQSPPTQPAHLGLGTWDFGPVSSGVRVLSSGGEAVVEASVDGRSFRYRPLRGDPLAMLAVWEQLKRAGKLDAAGFAPESELFAATLGSRYPDALLRLAEWAGNIYVENPASVMISLADGYYSGSGVFQRIVDLQSTHGALSRGSTLGFAMSTDGPFPHALRLGEVLSAE
jgi:hypothetical protein